MKIQGRYAKGVAKISKACNNTRLKLKPYEALKVHFGGKW